MTGQRTFHYYLPDKSSGDITVPDNFRASELLEEVKKSTGRSDLTCCRRHDFGCPFDPTTSIKTWIFNELDFLVGEPRKRRTRCHLTGIPFDHPFWKAFHVLPVTTIQDVIESSGQHPESGDVVPLRVLVNGVDSNLDDPLPIPQGANLLEIDIHYGLLLEP
jgi:hypothetical protein